MLATTRSQSPRARPTRLRCPPWRAPIVGTRPTVRPWARQASEVARMPATRCSRAGVLTAGLDLFRRLLQAWPVPAIVRMFGTGKSALGDLARVLLRGPGDLLRQVGVLLDELGRAARGQAEQVVDDQHLAVAVRPGTDADGRDAEGRGHLAGELAGDPFQHQAEGAGVLQGAGVGEDSSRPGRGLAL